MEGTMAALSTVKDYLTRERLDDLLSLGYQYRWYLAGTAVAGWGLHRALSTPRGLPPGPRGWPLVGAVTQLSSDMHEDCARLGHKYGDVFSLYVFGRLMVILNTHEATKQAFIKQGEDFSHRPQSRVAEFLSFHDEIFDLPYSEEWKAKKKFAVMTLRSYGFGTPAGEERILEQVDNMAAVIREHGGRPLDLAPLCRKAAACVIFGITLGKSFTYEEPEFVSFLGVLEEWLPTLMQGKFVMVEVLPHWLSWLLVPGYKRKLREQSDAYVNKLLEYIRAHADDFDPENPRDVVDGYLKERGVDHFDPEIIASNIVAFTADAVVTMATVFNAIMFYMARHQDEQSRVQEQLDAVVGRSRKVTVKDKSELPLVDAAIYEAFRLFSVATMSIPRVTKRDVTLNGYRIPEGSYIISNFWGIHMNPASYPEPQNYRLDHFLNDDGSLVRSPEALVTFGVGQRMCLGEQLTKMELYLLVSNLLLKYKIGFEEGYTPPSGSGAVPKTMFREILPFKAVFTER